MLVPRRLDCGHRDKVWQFVRPHWETIGPVYEGHHDGPGPFNRSKALNKAAELAGGWDVAVAIDADVIAEPDNIHAAIDHAVKTGGPALAYTDRVHLTHNMTLRILAGYDGDWMPGKEARLRNSCSSANVVTRRLWDTVGGFDEQFIGWGWEDVAFKHATETLSGQRTRRIPGIIWHLWHPVGPETRRGHPQLEANAARHNLYKAARHNPDLMRQLATR